MRWSKWTLVAAAAAALGALVTSGAGPEAQLTVYTARTSYSLPLLDRGGNTYFALADLLSPLGAPPPRNKGKEWRFELNQAEARITEGKEKAAIRGSQIDLGGKVLVEDARVLVPMSAALPLLARLLNTTVDFHQPSHRIFVGNAFTRFSAAFRNGEAPTLVLNFSQPVAPELSQSEGRTMLIFRKEPLVSDVNKQQFGDGAIQSLTFTEENGTASLTVSGNSTLKLIRSDDGRTIALEPEPAPPSAAQTPGPSNPASAEGQRRTQEFFVMIDPGHGGYDKGADFGGRLLEKDITLKLARELRKELEERGIASRMLRDSDVDVDLQRRAEITNEQRAGIYIAIHAGRPGRGIRVYTPLLANPPQAAVGRFLPWESAQAAALDRSKAAARAISTELTKRGLTVATLGMPIRPLNNIAAPAIAVELAPEGDDLQSVESARRNNNVAAAVAAGVAQVRGQLGARP